MRERDSGGDCCAHVRAPTRAHSLTHSLTHSLIHSLTHARTHARTHTQCDLRDNGDGTWSVADKPPAFLLKETRDAAPAPAPAGP